MTPQEKQARLKLVDLLYQDPREWVAEGEARAVAEWKAENQPPKRPDPLYTTSGNDHGRNSAPAPRCSECEWEVIMSWETEEPVSWALVERCGPCARELWNAQRVTEEPILPGYVVTSEYDLCLAGPGWTCLCSKCRPEPQPRLPDCGRPMGEPLVGDRVDLFLSTTVSVVVRVWTALYRGLAQVWDAMMRRIDRRPHWSLIGVALTVLAIVLPAFWMVAHYAHQKEQQRTEIERLEGERGRQIAELEEINRAIERYCEARGGCKGEAGPPGAPGPVPRFR